MNWNVVRTLTYSNPGNQTYSIAPGETLQVFNGVRSTSIAANTQFTLAASSLGGNLYRLTHSGGTAPAFRTDRLLTLNGVSLTLTLNVNGTLTMVGSAGSFSAVLPGDTLFLPGPLTGDSATPFSANNQGYWTVLTSSSTTLQLRRPAGSTSVGASEVVSPTSNSQVQAFSSSGVQIGDSVRLSAGFSASSLKTYEVTSVNPAWVEIYSADALPVTQTATPGTSGIGFYTNAKNFLYIEYTQKCVLQFNGDTGSTNEVEPVVAGDDDETGISVRFGPCWSLSVVNTSQETLKLLVGGAE